MVPPSQRCAELHREQYRVIPINSMSGTWPKESDVFQAWDAVAVKGIG